MSENTSSAYIQRNFGNVLDDVLTGATRIIERYSRPVAAIISYSRLQRLEELEALERKLIDARLKQVKQSVEPMSAEELLGVIDEIPG